MWLTPFGTPVEPPVKISSAKSSSFGSRERSRASDWSVFHASSVVPPGPSVSRVGTLNCAATAAAFSSDSLSLTIAQACTSPSCFLSSDGVKNGLIGATCEQVAIDGQQRDVHLDRVRHQQNDALAALGAGRLQALREAGHGAAEFGIADALLLEDHGRKIRLRVDCREQHVHEALVLRQRRVQGPRSADV